MFCGRLICWVKKVDAQPDGLPRCAEGEILEHDGDSFSAELEAVGSTNIGDHSLPKPPRAGLLAFEGWVELGPGQDPDPWFVGEWRELTHWEMCQLRCGERICGGNNGS